LFELAPNGYEQYRQNFQKFSLNLTKQFLDIFYASRGCCIIIMYTYLSNLKILATEIDINLKTRTTSSKQKMWAFYPTKAQEIFKNNNFSVMFSLAMKVRR